MSYESGVLVRRQQREYPQELRQEIALSAIELGNNREVARLFSLQLGYAVNESTVRGIKKRYLEGIQKGKIAAPAGLILNCFSPRSSKFEQSTENSEGHNSSHEGSLNEGGPEGSTTNEEVLEEDFSEEFKEDLEEDIQPESVMKLQLEILEGKMKEEVCEDRQLGEELMDDSNPLSIDEQDDAAVNNAAGTIRINKGIQNQASNALKRKSEHTNGTGPVIRKSRPSNAENEADISTLEKEVRALHWLARRKEQEWDQVIRLLKQKEERLMQAQRTRTLIRTDSEHVLSRALVLPKRNTLLITNPAKRPAVTAAASNLNAAASNVAEITEDKISNAIQKATENLGKEAVKEKTKTPECQGCKKRKSEFVCAGCSNRWYCSRECQVEDWDDHADECSG